MSIASLKIAERQSLGPDLAARIEKLTRTRPESRLRMQAIVDTRLWPWRTALTST
ncbi:MAG: hypothetical protein LBC91_05035 [Candidatus Accumulibacter sp.]|jgi:plasmid maintenance system antidote protein VapI|nr:hypothetical protein [Accumulibacter sp.]